MKIADDDRTFQCPYGHAFLGRQVKLVPFKNQTGLLLGETRVMKEPGGIVTTGGRIKEGYLLSCPTCGVLLLGGAQLTNQASTLTDKAAPVRKIHLVTKKC